MSDKSDITGTFGQPPAHAPKVDPAATTIIPAPTAEQLVRMRQNEQMLQPLNFEQAATTPSNSAVAPPSNMPGPPATPAPPAAVVTGAQIESVGARPVTSSLLRRSRLAAAAKPLPAVPAAAAQETSNDTRLDHGEHAGSDARDGGADRPDGVAGSAGAAGAEAGDIAAADAADAPRPAQFARPPVVPPIELDKPFQPAFSNTDSPSRGIPRPIDDPGKRVTGGFGDMGEAQYFPLDGTELRELVLAQMDRLVERLKDDLRFSIAVTYPRVRAKVEITVEGYAEDSTFVIPAVARPHDRTPLEVAKEHGREIVFVVTDETIEMTADGESITPPNAIRQSLGLEVPQKRFVQAGAVRTMVDVVGTGVPGQ